MRLKTTRPREPVADAIARLVGGHTWSGTGTALFAALQVHATSDDLGDPAWPRSSAAFGAGLLGLSDALRDRVLRLYRMPDALLIEPVPAMTAGPAPARDRVKRRAA